MEELRNELINLISEKGPLDEKTILTSQELDKLIVSHYYSQNGKNISSQVTPI